MSTNQAREGLSPMEIIQHGRLKEKSLYFPHRRFPALYFPFFSCGAIAVACPPPMSGKMKEAENIVVARTDRAKRGEERSTPRSFLFSFFPGKASGGGGGSFFLPFGAEGATIFYLCG